MSAARLMAEKHALLKAALVHAPFDGFTETTLGRASRDAGVDSGLAGLAFPRGATDLLDFFASEMDEAMAKRAAALDLSAMRMRERAIAVVRARLEALEPHREAERRAVALLALPHNAALAARLLARTVDRMWRLAGDASTDFSYYTKRALLGSVYAVTLAYWLADGSPGREESWGFLGRRIDDVLAIGKARAKIEAFRASLPSPFALFGAPR